MARAHPSFQDILDAFGRLGERVAASSTTQLDPLIEISVRRAMKELRRFIPGLDPPPDPEAARFLVRAANAAMEDNDAREALSRTLRGLSFAPHHPGLWFLTATACFDYGELNMAVRVLRHVLWIHPGHTGARRDLEALVTYMGDQGIAIPPADEEPWSDIDDVDELDPDTPD